MMVRRVGCWVLAGVVGVGVAAGQVMGGIGSGAAGVMGGGTGGGASSLGVGAPYSLVETTTTVRQLADGTTITQVERCRRMRDSEGRRRTETAKLVDGTFEIEQIQVQDPVEHAMTMLFPKNKKALVMRSPAPRPPTPEQVAAEASLAASYNVDPETMRRYEAEHGIEKLPPRTIEGLRAEGQRQTTVIPAGTMGNDREIRVVTETWTSPELNLYLECTSDDPRAGKTTRVVSEVRRTEPDAALFQVPADYQVVEQKRPGTQ